MISPAHTQLMARYNQWQNRSLYTAADGLSDADRKLDQGAFFGSIHGTLNHLLWGDRMWLGRFIDEPCTAPAFGADMFDDFSTLARERETTDRKMLDWAGKTTASWLAETLRYTSKVDGRTRELPRAVAAVHLFNHGTHHRGQLTTLLRQAGHDPGVTDLPWLPGVVRIIESP